jgi:hypothetical protein
MPEEILEKRPKPRPAWELIVGVIIGALLFGAIGYLAGSKNANTTNDATATATTVADDSATVTESASTTTTADMTANWKTYTNDTYGFSFRYPNTFAVSEDKNYTSLDNKNAQTIIIKNSTNSLTVWINPDGFGLEGASDRYTANIANGKINVTEKIQNQPSEEFPVLDGRVVLSNMLHNNDTLVAAYNFDIKDRVVELTTFDQILSTFQFTK